MSTGENDRETLRLAALHRYAILDTPKEAVYDDITRLAAQVCQTPIALISLLDETRQWFKSRLGIDVDETPRDIAFCNHAIRGSELFEVPDALQDPRFTHNPLVTGPPDIRYYAGVPLATPDGYNLGTLCVIDRKSRQLTVSQSAALEALARQVVTQLELRLSLEETEAARRQLAAEIERRNQMAEAQRLAERFMGETIDALPDHIAIVDADGTIVHVNNAWNNFADSNNGGVLAVGMGKGTNYLQVCDRASINGEQQAAEFARELRRALAGHSNPDFALEYPCHAPGKKRWFIARIAAFHDSAGIFAVISHQNITQRKLAEKAVLDSNKTLEARVESRTHELSQAYASLQASEEKFRSIFENSAVGFAISTPVGEITQTNQAFRSFFGPSESAATSLHLSSIIHPDDLEELQGLRQLVLKGQIPGFVREIRFLRPDRELIWMHISVAAIRDSSGTPQNTMALVQNITHHKQAEYERDSFFELSVDMFCLVDFNGRVHRINPACSRILGYSEQELLGMDYVDLIYPEDRQQARATLSNLMQNNLDELSYLEVRMQKKGGEPCIIRWSAVPWMNENLIIAVGRDMTRIRDNERALRALAERLQGIREEERTRISREIHDELGQMLTALKMDLTLLARDAEGPDGDFNRQALQEELSAVVDLVNATLRSVRRIAQELRPEILDALGLVPAIRWQARDLQERTRLNIDIEADQEPQNLTARQSTELFRIVQEALTNVIRHANANNANITVSCSSEETVLTVADDGCGYNRSATSAPSLGILGMRERAASIGASFAIRGEPGSGTTLTVRLPAAVSSANDQK
ncbi:PAS domain S-box protein [Pseudomaricurvus alcaniphilus]|uniref:PAS domain S-box protein n=1 Tax=Pseudomaricurvus alcaniphilus TaxID=1166482 RepID=UPI00140BC9C5|nr:PAS domain S-box protein [Pseudomaricurvus alcaniphilus]NHN36257.1 PAS domain S-box protein [Pseudomaricurvus alcaniphilus]